MNKTKSILGVAALGRGVVGGRQRRLRYECGTRQREDADCARPARHPPAHRRLLAPPRQLHEQRQRLRRPLHGRRHVRRLPGMGHGEDLVPRPRAAAACRRRHGHRVPAARVARLRVSPDDQSRHQGDADGRARDLDAADDHERHQRPRRHRALGRRLRGHVREDGRPAGASSRACTSGPRSQWTDRVEDMPPRKLADE